MRFAEADLDAHGRAFAIPEDTMKPGQQDMRGHQTDNHWLVFGVLQPGAARLAVADRCAAR